MNIPADFLRSLSRDAMNQPVSNGDNWVDGELICGVCGEPKTHGVEADDGTVIHGLTIGYPGCRCHRIKTKLEESDSRKWKRQRLFEWFARNPTLPYAECDYPSDSAKRACQSMLTALKRHIPLKHGGIWISGTAGSGKTLTACALASDAFKMDIRVMAFDTAEWRDRPTDQFFGFINAIHPQIVIFNDLLAHIHADSAGASRASAWLCTARNAGAAVVVTDVRPADKVIKLTDFKALPNALKYIKFFDLKLGLGG